MSASLAGGVALAYAAGVVTVHRVAVARRRALAQGYPTLRWLDWDALLTGVLPPSDVVERDVPYPKEGGPAPRCLQRALSPDVEVLERIIVGDGLPSGALDERSFSGGEAHWLSLLSRWRDEPVAVLEELEHSPMNTPQEVYLREWLNLNFAVTPFNLELVSFGSKRRLYRALRQFGDRPELYFARAAASALLGFTSAVLDDLGRAVYFSHQAPFYVEAVVQMPFIEEMRPALARACHQVANYSASTFKLSK